MRSHALVDEDAHGGRVAQAAADGDGVGGVQRERVAGGDRGGDAALGHVGVRGLQRALGDERDGRSELGGVERRIQAGEARSQHEHVGADGVLRGHRRRILAQVTKTRREWPGRLRR